MRTLTWPLRLGANGSLAAVDQDTDQDIDSCITAILAYPAGWRDDNPSFGCGQMVFRQGGADIAAITSAVKTFERRATPRLVASALTQRGAQTITVNAGTVNG